MADEVDTSIIRVRQLSIYLPQAMSKTAQQHVVAAHGVDAVHTRLEYANLEAIMEIDVESTDAANGEELMNRLPHVIEALHAHGVDLEKVRSRKRHTGSIEGGEVVLRLRQGIKTHVLCLWASSFQGPGDGDMEQLSANGCRIVFQMSVPDPWVEEGLNLWDRALDTASLGETP